MPKQTRLLKAVVFDWAGTTVDFGSIAPLQVILDVFKLKNVPITFEEAKAPMGKEKRDHLRELFGVERIKNEFKKVYGREPGEQDVIDFHKEFEPKLYEILPHHTEPLPGVLETILKLRIMGLKIGSTTGYTREIMNVVSNLAAKKGYTPDCIVTPTEVSRARPHPWMIFKNAENLGIFPIQSIVKVGDTVQDVLEGRNAGCWTVGVLRGSCQVGLTLAQFNALAPEEKEKQFARARKDYLDAGADYVIESIENLPALLTKINRKMEAGRHPGLYTYIPDNPYRLFTPGPLGTTKEVKLAMMTDHGSRETEYMQCVQRVRKRLTELATQNAKEFTTVIMQGSGTFGIEATIATVCGPKSRLLVIINGEYGRRAATIAKRYGIPTVEIEFPENEVPSIKRVQQAVEENPGLTHGFIVHNETTTGILNPLNPIVPYLKSKGLVTIVDAMSSFGGIPLDVDKEQIDFTVSCSNKCLQGIPGFAFTIARMSELEKCKGNSKSLSLDLYDQWKYTDKTQGSFRFTSPTHVIRAMETALKELDLEGGIEARHKRYLSNQKTLAEGMKAMGFQIYDLKEHQGPCLTTFYSPKSPAFSFTTFYEELRKRKFVIYPGKLAKVDSFRIGSIGHLVNRDMRDLLAAIKEIKNW